MCSISDSIFDEKEDSEKKTSESLPQPQIVASPDDAAFAFSQDSIYSSLTKRKSSSVSRPIHQYGRKKRRRRNCRSRK